MKALVLEAKGRLVYTDVPEPTPVGERPVLVRIAAVGVCGSDLPRFAADAAYHYPLILGHEFSAVVEEAPAGSPFPRGSRVAVFPLLPDRRDPFSRVGEYAVSSGYDYFGSRRDGAFAERLYVPEENLVPIPAGVPLLYAAVVEPAAVSLHAMRKFRLPANASALVIGGGPIGAFAAQWLRILGCTRVLVAEVDLRKREILQRAGFEVIDAGSRDTVAAIGEATGGRGVDCAVEACGQPVTLLQALEAAATFGQVVLLGDHHHDITLPAPLVSSLLRRELAVYGTWNSKITPPGSSEWEMVLHHMQSAFDVGPFISHTPTLSQGPEVFAELAARRVWYNKVVFAVSAEAVEEARRRR
jgi:L-iditol 2-dehydrogenase